jgi:hypothetical protein
MSLRDDLLQEVSAMLAGDEIGVTAIVSPAAGGPGWALNGKFRAPYRSDQFGSMDVGGEACTFLVATADKAALKRGDTLTIDGADYRHIEPQDGNPTAGLSILQLAPL